MAAPEENELHALRTQTPDSTHVRKNIFLVAKLRRDYTSRKEIWQYTVGVMALMKSTVI